MDIYFIEHDEMKQGIQDLKTILRVNLSADEQTGVMIKPDMGCIPIQTVSHYSNSRLNLHFPGYELSQFHFQLLLYLTLFPRAVTL